MRTFYIIVTSAFFKEEDSNNSWKHVAHGYDNDGEIIHSAVASRVSHAEREQTFNCKEGSRQASKSKLAKQAGFCTYLTVIATHMHTYTRKASVAIALA